ncbi:hypothetical protein Ae706Ps2_6028 [Pseudonocardia sp. Ae706_Ps2]|nr:hypothetical protein Ae706Ps2_6028 [Pseudonocardia sp. Ae706_Ps2]
MLDHGLPGHGAVQGIAIRTEPPDRRKLDRHLRRGNVTGAEALVEVDGGRVPLADAHVRLLPSTDEELLTSPAKPFARIAPIGREPAGTAARRQSHAPAPHPRPPGRQHRRCPRRRRTAHSVPGSAGQSAAAADAPAATHHVLAAPADRARHPAEHRQHRADLHPDRVVEAVPLHPDRDRPGTGDSTVDRAAAGILAASLTDGSEADRRGQPRADHPAPGHRASPYDAQAGCSRPDDAGYGQRRADHGKVRRLTAERARLRLSPRDQ